MSHGSFPIAKLSVRLSEESKLNGGAGFLLSILLVKESDFEELRSLCEAKTVKAKWLFVSVKAGTGTLWSHKSDYVLGLDDKDPTWPFGFSKRGKES